MSNIAIVSHGFRMAAKAMSKTARGCRSQSPCESKQHPAILPWPSGFPRCARALARRSNRQPFGCPGKRRRHLAIRHGTRGIFPRANFSTANTEPLNQPLVTPLVRTPKVVENLTPLRHELQQPAARVVVLDMRLEVLGQIVD